MKKVHNLLLLLAQIIGFLQTTFVVAFPSSEAKGTTPLSITPDIQKKLSEAIRLTTLSANDIDQAHKVCDIWDDLLSSNQQQPKIVVPQPMLAICYALQGSCLARIGQDKLAIRAFDSCLSLKKNDGVAIASPETRQDAQIGKGSCLQRLMQYEEARSIFAECGDELKLIITNKNDDDNSKQKKYGKAIFSAVTCSLRIGDYDWAYNYMTNIVVALNQQQTERQNKNEFYNEARGMLGILFYLCQFTTEQKKLDKEASLTDLLKLLKPSSKLSSLSSSPLYKWVYNVLVQKYGNLLSSDYTLLPMNDMSSTNIYWPYSDINVSPFDDPCLLQLDDKILLHELVGHNNNHDDHDASYVPQGFILPQESELMVSATTATTPYTHLNKNNNNNNNNDGTETSPISSLACLEKDWILKQRAGYGSHGNQLVSLAEAIKYAAPKDITSTTGSFLCQRMVHPPLLINDRKFTLRLYVVYFMNGNHTTNGRYNNDVDNSSDNKNVHPIPYLYISRIGLVKLASAPYHSDDDDTTPENDESSIHMTNSGRETSMLQYDLEFLRHEFEKKGWSYEELWTHICKSVKQVMRAYQESSFDIKSINNKSTHSKTNQHYHQHHQQLAALGIPKILGFDYMLDSKRKPWLLEVNRFPGLEARDNSDELVKRTVVQDAWSLASKRMNFTATKSETTHVGLSRKSDISFDVL